MADEKILSDRPEHRPLERFWPYAELPEQPSDEELAALHPELRAVLFGEAPKPFSVSKRPFDSWLLSLTARWV